MWLGAYCIEFGLFSIFQILLGFHNSNAFICVNQLNPLNHAIVLKLRTHGFIVVTAWTKFYSFFNNSI